MIENTSVRCQEYQSSTRDIKARHEDTMVSMLDKILLDLVSYDTTWTRAIKV